MTYGKTIGDISGNPQYDAARANWGGAWRMPTMKECRELIGRCAWKWIISPNGKNNGYKVTGHNGNSIFFPAAGSRSYASFFHDDGHYHNGGHYWSSSTEDLMFRNSAGALVS